MTETTADAIRAIEEHLGVQSECLVWLQDHLHVAAVDATDAKVRGGYEAALTLVTGEHYIEAAAVIALLPDRA